jgi:hypothetical protein
MKSYSSHRTILTGHRKIIKHPSCHFLNFTSLSRNDFQNTWGQLSARPRSGTKENTRPLFFVRATVSPLAFRGQKSDT